MSKFLALVLRHKPETIGVLLDSGGWVSVDVLITACVAHDCPLTKERLRRIVENNDKKRFQFSEDERMIRAAQGHSADVDLGYERRQPPDILYHGTAVRFLASIKEQGLQKQKRHHVHLSTSLETATSVGRRYGKVAVLTVNARQMQADGHAFFVSANGVWLTDSVPVQYITFPHTLE